MSIPEFVIVDVISVNVWFRCCVHIKNIIVVIGLVFVVVFILVLVLEEENFHPEPRGF